ncbi:MAG: hypothetical protein Q8920_15265 [Bacillota bacterium]|nr:hypothetical protein [Bacillota bacterium]
MNYKEFLELAKKESRCCSESLNQRFAKYMRKYTGIKEDKTEKADEKPKA